MLEPTAAPVSHSKGDVFWSGVQPSEEGAAQSTIDQQPCLLASFEVFIAYPPTSSPTLACKCEAANWTWLSLCYSFINFFLWSGRIDFPEVQPPAARASPQTFPVQLFPQPHFFLLSNIHPSAELNSWSISRLPGHLELNKLNAFYDHGASCTRSEASPCLPSC